MAAKRICLWSSPRNLSTAMMYSFAQRPTCRVFDEPLYPHFLRVTGAQRPDREDTLAWMDTDGETVVKDLILAEYPEQEVFFKLMPHFLVDLDRSFLHECENVLLTRDPAEILSSYTKVIAEPSMQDIGMTDMHDLYHELAPEGKIAAVLDAEFIRRNPESVLRQLCERLNIPFSAQMLSWEAGPRPEDGPWAKYWYHNLHRSTGFQPYAPKTINVPEAVQPLLATCQPLYQELRSHAIRP